MLFLRLTRKSRPTKAHIVTNDREGFLGNSSSLNFLLDVVLNLQDVCLPMPTFLLRRFYFYTAPPITLVFIPDKKTVKKVIKKVAISCTFLSYCRHFERPMKHRSYLMMLPNYAFYFPLFGALETFFGARHY